MKNSRRRQTGKETTRKIHWKRDQSSFQSQNIKFKSSWTPRQKTTMKKKKRNDRRR